MKILNETVYATDDLERVILFAQQKGYELAMERWRANPTYSLGVPVAQPRLQGLPAQIRFGYFNMVPLEERKPNKRGHINTEVSYISTRGRYRSNGVMRIGIIRPNDLPLAAMEIVARAASDQEDRTLPPAVMAHLLRVLVGTLFHSWITEEAAPEVAASSPAVHYGFTTDTESAKASRGLARAEREDRATKALGWCKSRITRLKENLVEEEQKLVKLQAKIDKSKSRKEMSYVG